MQGSSNLEFLDLITLAGFILQVANFGEDMRQASNDVILSELQKQDKKYLERIIQNQEKILEKLAILDS